MRARLLVCSRGVARGGAAFAGSAARGPERTRGPAAVDGGAESLAAAEASAVPAGAATAVEAAVQRVLSARGAAGDVPAQAGRSLSDRAGDARRPLSRTLRQLGPPSRNRPTLAGLGLCSFLRPDPVAEGGRRLPS